MEGLFKVLVWGFIGWMFYIFFRDFFSSAKRTVGLVKDAVSSPPSPKDMEQKAARAAKALRDMAIDLNQLDPEEKKAVEAANIPLEKYLQETLFVRCFAIDLALLSVVFPHDNLLGMQIRNACPSAWSEISYQSLSGRDLFFRFTSRMTKYHEAHDVDMSAPEGALSMRFPSAFVHNLQPEGGEVPFELMPHAMLILSPTYKGACNVLRGVIQ